VTTTAVSGLRRIGFAGWQTERAQLRAQSHSREPQEGRRSSQIAVAAIKRPPQDHPIELFESAPVQVGLLVRKPGLE
jgi:hypothetical protein